MRQRWVEQLTFGGIPYLHVHNAFLSLTTIKILQKHKNITTATFSFGYNNLEVSDVTMTRDRYSVSASKIVIRASLLETNQNRLLCMQWFRHISRTFTCIDIWYSHARVIQTYCKCVYTWASSDIRQLNNSCKPNHLVTRTWLCFFIVPNKPKKNNSCFGFSGYNGK